jgi:hypothetical protein
MVSLPSLCEDLISLPAKVFSLFQGFLEGLL